MFKDEYWADFARKEKCETIGLGDFQLEGLGFKLLTKDPTPVIQGGSNDGDLLMWYTDNMLHIGQRYSDDGMPFSIIHVRAEKNFLMSCMRKMLA